MQKVLLALVLASGLVAVTAQPSADCVTFCNAYYPACNTTFTDPNAPWIPTGTDPKTQCLNLCATWGATGTTGNTVGCRQAKLTGSPTQTTCTQAAHVTSDGQCGDQIAVYCDTLNAACPGQYPTIAGGCAARAVSGVLPWSFPTGIVASGNSLQCRIYHTAVAASYPLGSDNRKAHCNHGGPYGSSDFSGQPNTDGWASSAVCGSACENYCNSVMLACTGANAQYPNITHCLNVCRNAIPDGNGHFMAAGAQFDTIGDSFYCRHYHAQVAISVPDPHCSHAGINSAVGACQDSCASFCTQNEIACAASNPTIWGRWNNTGGVPGSTCLTECNGNYFPTDSTYPAAQVTAGDSLQCRAYHSRVAQAGGATATTHCPHALPQSGGLCGSDCDTFCSHAQVICTGNNQQWTNRTTCLAACAQFPSGGTLGDSGGNTFNCRWYHLNVAKAGGATADTHCPHIRLSSSTCTAATTTSSTGGGAVTTSTGTGDGGAASSVAPAFAVVTLLAIAASLKF